MMRSNIFSHIAAIALVAALLSSCHSQKPAATNVSSVADPQTQRDLISRVGQNIAKEDFITSKLTFSVEAGNLRQTLTGNLQMKRDDVIRLQLMAFGFVEAGRLEFTKDYVMLIDRINKQYFQMPYAYVSFLRDSGINFSTLQALFWNELFQPGKDKLTMEDADLFSTEAVDDHYVIRYEKADLDYSWLADRATDLIKMANISHDSKTRGKTELNWDYVSFGKIGGKNFPNDMKITLSLPDRDIHLGIKLNYLKNDSDWKTRTEVSAKYSKVELDDIMRRFMSL